MATDKTAIIEQIDEVLAHVHSLTRSRYDDHSDMHNEPAAEVVSLITSAIERLAPANSSYHRNAKLSQVTTNFRAAIAPLIGVLKALRLAYEKNYLQSIEELIHADMFADFLEMGDYLLQRGFKDPAAVIMGSVLEEHLRRLCAKNDIDTPKPDGAPKKAETLNSELAAANVYQKLDHKNVTAWLDLRNKAAHGEYSKYASEQVSLLLQGVRDFIIRYPA